MRTSEQAMQYDPEIANQLQILWKSNPVIPEHVFTAFQRAVDTIETLQMVVKAFEANQDAPSVKFENPHKTRPLGELLTTKVWNL